MKKIYTNTFIMDDKISDILCASMYMYKVYNSAGTLVILNETHKQYIENHGLYSNGMINACINVIFSDRVDVDNFIMAVAEFVDLSELE